jgi:septal ring factor EnvC (AmiA/AmiB activator)
VIDMAGGAVKKLWLLGLAVALIGCVDSTKISALSAELSQLEVSLRSQQISLKTAEERLAAVSNQIAQIAERKAALSRKVAQVEAESPTISSCIQQDLAAKGLMTAFISENKNESTAGWIVGGFCLLAQGHADYAKVSDSLKSAAQEESSIETERVQFESMMKAAEQDVQRIRSDIEIANLDAKLVIVASQIDCEKRLRCRLGMD